MDFLVAHFNLVRGLHILAVIAFMAGMLYLPRLFVYHTKAAPGSEMDETFKVMERRLLKGIINPASIATAVFGLGLILADSQIRGWDFLLQPWMVAKLAALVGLYGFHGFLSASRKKFERGENVRPEKFWRMVNEIPFVLAIVIVISATTKYLNH
ncbi:MULTISPECIES: CopD family protein [unclassified Caulobacter]|uniref:CopD family protein n=1 Tax=unclassified Caulobacter TaxID=2648921 RepID=UPI000781F9E1|nr:MULTISPECIES: CopD family protein [unclassified Caulobacter]AZS23275.1 CopD family protein [Caulobacter sp. FWC26]